MNGKKHISEDTFTQFRLSMMDIKERDDLLEHISNCDFCSDRFASHMMKDLVAAPQDLKSNIMKAVGRPELRLIHHVRKSSKRRQLLTYSLKVGTAIAGALLLLLSTSFNNKHADATDQDTDKFAVSLTSAIRDNMSSLNSSLSKLSNQIMSMEVNNYEEKEE